MKRIVEEDEYYGEDGAMLCDEGAGMKEEVEAGAETKPELKEQDKEVVPNEV